MSELSKFWKDAGQKTANIDTYCEHCRFYLPKSEGDSCAFGRITNFKARGVKVTEEPHPIIHNRVCNTLRPNDYKEDEELDVLVEEVRNDTRVRIDYVVAATDNELEDIKFSIAEIMKQKVEPSSIIVVVRDNKIVKSVIDFINSQDNPVRYQVVLNREEVDKVVERSIDIGVRKCRNQFYCPVVNGEGLQPSISDGFNRYLNEYLYQVMLVERSPDNPPIINTRIHRLLDGNNMVYIEDKIKSLAQDQERLDMVVTWEKLYERIV